MKTTDMDKKLSDYISSLSPQEKNLLKAKLGQRVLNTPEKIEIVGTIRDKSEFALLLPDVKSERGNIIIIKEGAGDALDHDDLASSFIDYIDYTTFALDADAYTLVEKDGGQYLLKESYCDMSTQDIIRTVLEDIGLTTVTKVAVIDANF